jgi:hypothetical protein
MMSGMEPDPAPDQPVAAGSRDPDSKLGLVQSREDTDLGWGEQPEIDDERLRRDRPPHWESD